MATTIDPNPSGELELVRYFYESSSGHIDQSREVKLRPGEGKLLEMTEVTDYSNLYGVPRSESTATWQIDRDELISLIKTHGKIVK